MVKPVSWSAHITTKGLGVTGTSVVGEAGKGATLKQVTCHCAPFSHAVIKALKVIVVFLSSEKQKGPNLLLSLFGPSHSVFPHNSRELSSKGVYCLIISIQTLQIFAMGFEKLEVRAKYSYAVSVCLHEHQHEQIQGQGSEAPFVPWQKRVLTQHATVYLEAISTRGINHREMIKHSEKP